VIKKMMKVLERRADAVSKPFRYSSASTPASKSSVTHFTRLRKILAMMTMEMFCAS
jgi:hypothetical protein